MCTVLYNVLLGMTFNDAKVFVLSSGTPSITLMITSVHSVEPTIFSSKYILNKYQYLIRFVLSTATNQSVFILITITSSTVSIVVIIVIAIIVIATSITVYWRKKKRQQYKVGGNKNVIN